MDTRRNEQTGGQSRVGVNAQDGTTPRRASGASRRNAPLAPGGVVGDGRYRLLAQFGIDERAGAHLWRARDGQLRRDVALTMLVGDPADTAAAAVARRTLERAAHAGKFNHAGVARVLDVLSLGNGISSGEGMLGIVVAEWTKGSDLVDLVNNQPIEPGAAARMVAGLTEAVEQAHQSGLVLGLDHPQRLRITPEGRLRLAFPGPLPEATLRDDVKALGGLLYLLLTGKWALPEGPSAIQSAPRSPSGRVVPPRSLQSEVPAELSSLAVRTIEDGGHGGIRTTAAILRVLDQAAEAQERTQLIKTVGATAAPVEDEGDGVWTTSKPPKDAARRRKLAIGLTVVVVAAVGILAWLGMMAISFFQDDPSSGGPPVNVADPTSQQAPPPGEAPAPEPPAAGGEPVKAASVKVYNPEGEGDSPARAENAIDGDPATVWKTDAYKQQFPGLKPGVGLIAEFESDVTVGKVRIDSGTAGTAVEIRVADDDNPQLDSTQVVGNGEITGPQTEIALQTPAQGRHILVWITKLAGEGDQHESEIAEITYLP
ncbi:hypothetical protein CFN78_13790 [Amycolatopsis antarctica]|uniref:Serine/threonine protein kinase n=1 Tax=Amycolatopsis antarctica TaxID=1854586 RepID=A0A263D5M1_9PSEU|nr:protein kinase family protein [Amycolatopsis antarctica]OZM72695.1 hypothetical protein CFN78_13790 [Amycolatopsis antarctica]